jgi:ribose-phosphate pyrophosphokinase
MPTAEPRGIADRGELVLAACRAAGALAEQLARNIGELRADAGDRQGVRLMTGIDFPFPDGEIGVRLEPGVDGRDVFLLQSLFNPAASGSLDENYLALLIAARAFREWGAAHVTAVTPYLAYARQDKPTPGMVEPTTAKLFADLAAAAGIGRLITWHPHCAQIRGFYAPMPVAFPDPLDEFVREFETFRGRNDVIAVAPDEGASRLVANFGRALGLRCAVATKHRPERGRAAITDVIGDFAGARVAIVLDDMISSGTTVRELVTALAAKTRVDEIRLAASHNLCRPAARETLVELNRSRRLVSVVVSDSVPQTPEFTGLPFLEVRPLGRRFAEHVLAVHRGSPAPGAAPQAR